MAMCAEAGCEYKTKNKTSRFCAWHSKLDYRPDGCIFFTGHINPGGYGWFRSPQNGGMVFAHRYAWELAGLPEPEAGWFHPQKNPQGWMLDHDDRDVGCGNPACVNVAHLKPAPGKRNQENIRPREFGSSRFRGVARHKRTGKWQARAQHNGKTYTPASEIPGWTKQPSLYDDEDEAARVAEALRAHLYGWDESAA